jgi:transcriptional regulator with PAS, ATPase and Fis domain
MRNNYNCKLTGKELGIHRTTLYEKFDRLKIKYREE